MKVEVAEVLQRKIRDVRRVNGVWPQLASFAAFAVPSDVHGGWCRTKHVEGSLSTNKTHNLIQFILSLATINLHGILVSTTTNKP